MDVRSESSFWIVLGQTCLGVSESIERIALSLDDAEFVEKIVDVRVFDFL